MGRTVEVRLKTKPYRICIEPGLLSRLGEIVASHVRAKRVVVITDDNVHRLYADRVSASLAGASMEPVVLSVAPGEGSKSLETVAMLYDRLSDLHVRRDETILALGGGVVGDLAGFAAATWLRGVPFIQVPTTVLSQVDSSVGGKVGINHQSGKNLIGSFYQPLTVLIDPETLRTLPREEVWAGLAEVLKYGFISDREFHQRVSRQLHELVDHAGDGEWVDILARCCEIKAAVVEADEQDLGRRHVLNFGHTLGHALEAATGYARLRHGEAVARGMVAALWLSHWLRDLPLEELELGLQSLASFPRPSVDGVTPAELLPHIAHDKKGTSTGQKWILLERIGRAVVIKDPPEELVLRAAERMLN